MYTFNYGPGTGDANICRIDSNGNVVAGQAGCYNLPSNCSDSIAAGQSADSSASYKFKGSGIYITGVLNSLSPVYTVDLDGTSKDVDGVVDSLPFTCAPLFSATNLDPNVEHTIRLSIKGPSPNRNMTVDPDGKFLTFAMANFMYAVLYFPVTKELMMW
ncbi:hypothetical protein JR316_0009967 [Psilocybe cubensis]|uniref:Uncharacterized protein n=2 Tax=Psilocybe cubensis TaxID=181762 RepID=A0A8H8CGY0_PSICU|nr:hypothetical protein JR316_0009967 [Psilocybe cubensis]KAH9477740.1 hypothetical protein JR316_0009967 [Psilocybe cubensis]